MGEVKKEGMVISDQDIAKGVESLLRHSDPNSITTLNGVVSQLEAKLGFDLSHKAGFIRDQIDFLLRPQQQQQHQYHHLQQQQQQQQQQPPPFFPPPSKDHFAPHPQPHFPITTTQPHHYPPPFALQHHPYHEINFQQPHHSHHHVIPPPGKALHNPYTHNADAVASPQQPKQSASTGVKRRGGAGGLNKVCGVSPELQVVVGEPALPRTEIVRQLWAYIRKNNLQDPGNKRKIICDDALRVVFETDCTDMFKMNKLLSKHIIPLGPPKEPQAKRTKVEAESTVESAEPASSTVKSVIISEALAKFLGTGGREMQESEAIRLVWDYIKDNNLEDPLNKMVILCDAKLQELLGCESISALGIPEMLTRHHLFKQSGTC